MTSDERGHLGYLFSGFASLLLVAFLDNARGPILPVLCQNLGIPYETAGLFLTVGSIAAVLSTYALGRAMKRWGERRMGIFACCFAAIPGVWAPWVSDEWKLLLLGLLLGSAVSLVGSMCSILTIRGSPAHKRGRYLSIQQVMYGLGSLSAPLIFRFLVSMELPWWLLLQIVGAALLLLGLSMIWVLPQEEANVPDPTDTPQKLGLWGILAIVTFSIYVGGEVLASMWMSSLLVDKQGMSPAAAAPYLIGFFLMVALTRFLCFLFVPPQRERQVLLFSLGAAVVFGILGQQGYSWALPAMGILGPFFPLCLAKVSLLFPRQWQQITIYLYIGIQSMLALMHLTVGKLADRLGIADAFLLSPALLALALALLYVFLTFAPSNRKLTA